MTKDHCVFDIPIYGGDLTIVFADDFIKYAEAHKLNVKLKPTSNNCVALTGRGYEVSDMHFFVFIKPEKIRPEIMAHEAVHVCNYVFDNRGVAVFTDEDEHTAYFIDWVVEHIVYAAVKCEKKITLMLGGYEMPLMYPTNEKHKKVLRDLRRSK